MTGSSFGSGAYGAGPFGGAEGVTHMNTDLLIVGATGIVSFGNVGATMPTTAVSTLTGFTDYGAVSDDGVTEANSTSWQSFKPWGATRKAKSSQTDAGKTFQMTFWETSPQVLALYYSLPTPPTVTAGAFDFAEPSTFVPVYKAMVLDTIEGNNHIRIACTKIQVTDRGNRVFNGSSIVGYQVTCDVIGDVHHYVVNSALT